MKVSFVRTQGQPDRVYVVRTSGEEVSWRFPNYGDDVPHDLVHFVVETAFGLARGVWGRVDEGLDLARANTLLETHGPDKYAGFGADRSELMAAEALAAGGWRRADLDDVGRLETIRGHAQQMNAPLPASVTLERIAEVHATLDALRNRWSALIPKGAIDVVFDPADLAGTFAKLRSAGAAGR